MIGKTKTVLITGASRGIGRACAVMFAENGYRVAINYNKNRDMALSLAHELTGKGYAAAVFEADVSDRTQVLRMYDEIKQIFGHIDVLVNNAGIAKSELFNNFTCDDWNELINVNLGGVFNCTQEAIHDMICSKHGKIINISSVWGVVGASCEVAYSTSKAAVIGFTKALAKELGPSGITVNCVAPGVIDTDMNKNLTGEDIEQLRQETPLERIGKPEDIASCVFFLASDGADFITGQIISPNGGLVI